VVDYYDTPTPLNQLAVISAPEPQLLTIRPYDPSSVDDIERAIHKSDLGLTPSNDGKLIRIAIPSLTEERRKEMVKHVNRRLEETKIALRNIRREALDDMREFEQEKLITEDDLYRGRDSLQELIDKYNSSVEETGKRKAQELLEV
jgi:ribosome recycling factor